VILDAIGHGLGSRGDLPIPLWQFAWAGTAALAISFLALGMSWQQPKLVFLEQGRPVKILSKLVKVVEPLLRILSLDCSC